MWSLKCNLSKLYKFPGHFLFYFEILEISFFFITVLHLRDYQKIYGQYKFQHVFYLVFYILKRETNLGQTKTFSRKPEFYALNFFVDFWTFRDFYWAALPIRQRVKSTAKRLQMKSGAFMSYRYKAIGGLWVSSHRRVLAPSLSHFSAEITDRCRCYYYLFCFYLGFVLFDFLISDFAFTGYVRSSMGN